MKEVILCALSGKKDRHGAEQGAVQTPARLVIPGVPAGTASAD